MNDPVYHKHIFICTNQRTGGDRKSCGEQHGMELVAAFKKLLKEKNLPIRVRAQRAGCLDICDFGPTVAVYPEGIFYVNVQLSDVEEIIQSHIAGGKPVERLLLKYAKK
ncbi:MAG TPA: (2Fe-2S) ferredoxin domain-containing protein [Bacteroidia bacterium]|jgi:(2Fe-2S) ferredoxin|nr:(2Fe-2S) ferredoxin domain-containing protein [Bacteroidia bacterium]